MGKIDEVLHRARQTLAWAFDRKWMLETALDNLTLGRAYGKGSSEAAFHLDHAVEGLRRYGSVDYLPPALLARAANFRHTRKFDRAQMDLDEARTLSDRLGMRLHFTDCALEQVRIYLARKQIGRARPYYENAKHLVSEIKYGRRTTEMAHLTRQLA